MTPAEVAILTALYPDHTRTVAQLQHEAALTSCRTRDALARLRARGLVLAAHPRSSWRISPRGRVALATKGKRFAN
ncbi:hypothetical protein JK358_36415 [Nocardia sp. 2]|uniref:MarR family transcriptional regulator n=1 Tax=Nocardia acididurans TaxID=2802282 RepID=A0ABS1MGV1_9NOCA|nr:hypothetical protein [Nocardia acididurans]MBL1079895.1 hypothetical protein [Nocardia acididurans]